MPTVRRTPCLTLASFVLITVATGQVSRANATHSFSLLAPALPAPNRQTARTALDKAQAKAKAWHADAVLIEVSTDVDDKGTADNNADIPSLGWAYTFRSPSAKKRLQINVSAEGLSTVDSDFGPFDDPHNPMYVKPLPATFVDSDKVIAEAVSHGPAGKTKKYTVDLSNMHREDVSESVCWTVADDSGTFFTISATSGKFLSKVSVGH